MADPVMSAGRNHPLDQPSYGQLGEAAIAWLDELRSRDIKIEALYFDGYLPKAKRPVRLERSYRTSAQLKDVCSFYQRDNLPSFDVKGPRTGSLLPAPPFAVPAVLDALRESEVYGPVTIVVPGEADTFCAEHARTKGGGTVITSDSDLLVQDLGPDAEVVLFRDIADVRTATVDKPFIVPTFALSTIRRRLSLPSDKEGVMVDFAFELSIDSHLSVTELADQTKRGYAKTKYAQEYAEFAEQYAYPSSLVDGAKKYDITKLDPRVSEIVLQSLFPNEGQASIDSKSKKSSGEMFAFEPPLLDNCTRTNAWEPSAPIRACAFSLLQVLAGRRIKTVREYTRMASMATRGTELDLLPVAKLAEAVDNIANLIRRIRKPMANSHVLQWATLASYYDIMWSKGNGKTSICLEVMYEETSVGGMLDRVTWDAVHWLAEIQATLYSLRVLKQIVLFVLEASKNDDSVHLSAELFTSLTKLKELLMLPSTVPALRDYPVLRVLRDLPAKLKGVGALKLLAELADISEGIKFKAEVKKNKSKNKSKKRKRSDQAAGSAAGPAAGAKAASNPFAILGDE